MENNSKFVIPFSARWHHLQQLKKQGRIPQFGSYKYTADQLQKKGVLIEVEGHARKQYDKIQMTISSDETGLFEIEVAFMGVKMPQLSMHMKLEDLLQFQFDHPQQPMPLFDGAAKANVNLLLALLNRKFFQTN